MNKATRILSNMSSDDCRAITSALGDISEHADLGTQAQYINDLLDYAETYDITMQSVMYKCGGNCLAKEVIELAKGIYEKSSSMDEFLPGGFIICYPQCLGKKSR